MTDLLSRAGTRSDGRWGAASVDGRPPPSVLVAAVVAALWAAALGIATLVVVALVVWAADPRSGAGAAVAVKTAVQLWLLAHHVGLHVPGGVLAVPPLALTAAPVLLLARAGRGMARDTQVRSLPEAGLALGALVAPYATVAALAPAFAATPSVAPSRLQGLVGGAVVALVAGGYGVASGAGLLEVLWRRVPDPVRRSAEAGGVAVAVLVAGGGLVAAASLAWHADRAAAIAHGLHPGIVGGFALFVLCLALVPNGALWGLAYAVGPGFAVGTGTAVTPFGVHIGAVPALPVLGALPDARSGAGSGLLALTVPVVAGLVAGLLIARRRPDRVLWRAAVEGAGAGASAGVVVAVLTGLAGGSGGPGAMSAVGPSPWRTGLAAAGEVALLAAAVAVLVLAWRWSAVRLAARADV